MSKKKILLATVGVLLMILFSNLFLQWAQNGLSLDLALKFAFSWHTQKFFLGCFVLLVFWGFLVGISGSVLFSSVLYSVTIALMGLTTYLKMNYRQEPLYPDDMKMITQIGMIKDIVGWPLMLLLILLILATIGLFGWSIYRSLKLTKNQQILRVAVLILCGAQLAYISNFNDENNLLRKAYDKTALWIPYSQKMNYYNVGFVGGFLFNLKVEAMAAPEDYSKETVKAVTDKYKGTAGKEEEAPNIIYVMSESFSDPSNLAGVTVTGDPLKGYYQVADQTYSGKMLSQNYGGGTANIEFEALTGLSMELFNPQMTTPYTMLVPKMTQLPSMVSLTKSLGYQTTAIHPYDTSMYKRKDVYQVLGFDQFLDQDTMTHTQRIQNNEYISDAAAYQEIDDLLKKGDQPQFVHLVTMQTHMPYSGKYENIPYQVTANGNTGSISNYLQDVAYASEALKEFTDSLKQLPRRTLVVFWGDHLPGIYSEAIQEDNQGAALHETQFLIYDSKGELSKKEQHAAITSPIYFGPQVFSQSGHGVTGFYQLLLTLEKELPAFEKGMYQIDGEWQKELKLSQKAQQVYDDYRLIQYDLVSGKQYSMKENFFEDAK